ncbi:hypothetical protein [Salinibaculum rarum]|uniref:hypothetical protein n=1 Tax=Salinibaculum rarum TaxID=3058903 RepID=UPI00265D61C0|nr:hypothetical protein [Salinibaculum sp. KK48]
MPEIPRDHYLSIRCGLINSILDDLRGEKPPVDFRSAISDCVTSNWDAAFEDIPESALTKHAATDGFDAAAWFSDDTYPVHERIQLIARGAVINDIQTVFTQQTDAVLHVLRVFHQLDCLLSADTDVTPTEVCTEVTIQGDLNDSPEETGLSEAMVRGNVKFPVFEGVTTNSVGFTEQFAGVEHWLFETHPSWAPDTRDTPLASNHTEDSSSESPHTASLTN